MIFSKAMDEMSNGNKIQRKGWNGKGMFIFGIAGGTWDFTTDIDGVDALETLPFYCMKTVDNKLIPWTASQADIYADDWQVVE